jgi:predicted nuclease of predicted toxin-antitoxin system
MLFKLDENLPVDLAQFLSDLGHDTKTVKDQRLQGANDRVLLEKCDKEKRILINNA